MKGWFRLTATALVALAATVFLLNTSLFSPAPDGRAKLLAHRGLGQTFSRVGLTGETCTAERIFPPEHDLIEDTLPAIGAAFEHGAAMVEFDIQPTSDGEFVVFHDWTIDCRTDGKGVTRQQTLGALRGLDLGYGYTADGGKTFPFRGKGVGLMRTLAETLDAFPGKAFLINIKSNDPAEGTQLAAYLARRPAEDRRRLTVYGAGRAIAAFRAGLGDVRVLAFDTLRSCLLQYFGYGWTGIVPPACRGTVMTVPVDVARWMWGFPQRLEERLAAADTLLVLLGPLDGTGYSTGIDDAETLAMVPPGFGGLIWTNRVDRLGAALGRSGG